MDGRRCSVRAADHARLRGREARAHGVVAAMALLALALAGCGGDAGVGATAPSAAAAQSPLVQPPGTNRYGAREARICTDRTAPAEGAITPELAAAYVVCDAEKVSGYYLYLVEDVRVEVGGSRPYNPNMDLNVPDIDVAFPLYSIRGGMVTYQCVEVNPDFSNSAPGRNCNRTNQPDAKGYCYRTTFADWRCNMIDLGNDPANWQQGVAPPVPAA
jgi:hypothetical protein